MRNPRRGENEGRGGAHSPAWKTRVALRNPAGRRHRAHAAGGRPRRRAGLTARSAAPAMSEAAAWPALSSKQRHDLVDRGHGFAAREGVVVEDDREHEAVAGLVRDVAGKGVGLAQRTGLGLNPPFGGGAPAGGARACRRRRPRAGFRGKPQRARACSSRPAAGRYRRAGACSCVRAPSHLAATKPAPGHRRAWRSRAPLPGSPRGCPHAWRGPRPGAAAFPHAGCCWAC